MNIIERLGFNKYFRDQYLVEDQRGSDNIKILFILESPHISEISEKVPASGKTGQIMSKVIMNENFTPFGKLLEHGDPSTKFFAIMNVLQIPMQLGAYDFEDRQRQELIKINGLKSFNATSYAYNVGEHKAKIIQACQKDSVINSISEDFSSRFHNLMVDYQPKLVIPCGVIVQAFFEKINKRVFRFEEVTSHSCEDHFYKVFYTYHPSPRSGDSRSESKWITDHRHIKILKREIENGLKM